MLGYHRSHSRHRQVADVSDDPCRLAEFRFVRLLLNPNSAVEKSRGRNLGWYGVEKWNGGNDFVGMAWSLVGKRPFQLRRNRKSVGHRAQAPQELGSIGLWHRKTDLYPAPLRDQISAHQKHEVSNRSQPSFKPRARQHRL